MSVPATHHAPLPAEQERHASPVTAEAAAILSLVERAARDPSIDLDRMERLIAMGNEARRQAAEREFNAALSRAQAAMPQVYRAATNSHNNSRYARLEDIHAAITPVITANGFSLSFDTEPCDVAGHYRMVCTVAHAGGHSRQHRADLPSDAAGAQGRANKTALQGFGSTMSYGRRYLTLLIFNVALTNEDNDGQPIKPRAPAGCVTEEEASFLGELVHEVGADLPAFLRHMGVPSLADVPADRYDQAVAALEAKRRRAATPGTGAR